MKYFLTMALALASFQSVAQTDFNPISTGTVNYDWMNKVVNLTPNKAGSCPVIGLDQYGKGFSVARETAYYLSISATMSRWYNDLELWTSVGVGPIKDGFGLFFTQADDWDEVLTAKTKKLPTTAAEIAKWKVSDGAYWESFGGVSFYLGTGIAPINIGSFIVAKGGWTNYLQKTGPQTVYVERAKNNIKSISFGAGISFPAASHQRLVQAATGFSYEFVLDNPESIEAFERFMVGDTTKAQDLSEFEGSGVMKISDTASRKVSFTNSIGVQTPFVPIISFRRSTERSYNTFEENSSWDENTEKNYGVYVKQKRSRLLTKHLRESRTFLGGIMNKDFPDYTTGGRTLSDNLYGTFTYHYESNWGQEIRLDKYVERAQRFTGITEETCVKVPEINNTLGYNQVKLEMKWSNEYIAAILGLNTPNTNLFADINRLALNNEKETAAKAVCDQDDAQFGDTHCQKSNPAKVSSDVRTLSQLAAKMKTFYKSDDRAQYARHAAKFGEIVWKSPALFYAFFEKGKECGQEFNYEVSGTRLNQHIVAEKYDYSANCN